MSRQAPEEIGANREEPETPEETSLNVSITLGDRAIAATMEDNAAAWIFLTRLPLEVTLNDFNNTTEKIFYPSPALTTEGVARGCAPRLAISRSMHRGATWRFSARTGLTATI